MNQAAPHHAKEARSIHFAEVLMARESITPKDAGCQSYLIYRLQNNISASDLTAAFETE